MMESFYSVTVIDSSLETHLTHTDFRATYDLNEAILHTRRIEDPLTKPLFFGFLIVGITTGGYLGPLASESEFLSLAFFISAFVGMLIATVLSLIAWAYLAEHRGKMYTARTERQNRGMSLRFILVDEDKWDTFVNALNRR
jgi:hypothetical protein